MKLISLVTEFLSMVHCVTVPKLISKNDLESLKNFQFKKLNFAAIRKSLDKSHKCACQA